MAHGRVASTELTGVQLQLRAEGRDWPLHGLTMTGLRRLDDLQSCVESVVQDRVGGDMIETGAWRGGSSILMRATLDALGAGERTVWVADSFEGFPGGAPEPDGADGRKEFEQTLEPYFSAFDFLAVPLEEVTANFARFGCEQGVRFVPGFFEETLPRLADRRWSLIRLDGDTYDATMLGLRCLYRGLAVGGYLIVDDYGALEECRAAVDTFRSEHGIDEPLEAVDWTCARWRRQSDAMIERPGGPGDAQAAPRPTARAVRRDRPRRVPSSRELQLAREVAELRDRLAHTESELSRTRDELERRLRETVESRSWRLTRPLRELNLRLKATVRRRK